MSSHLKTSLANLTKHSLDQLTVLVKTRVRRMQYRPRLIEGIIAKTGLDLRPPWSQGRASGMGDGAAQLGPWAASW